MTTLALIATAWLVLHAAFAWARLAHFRIEGAPPLGVRVIEVSSVCSVLMGGALMLHRPGPNALCDGMALALSLASAVLFGWGLRTTRRAQLSAAFSRDQPTELLTTGAFRVARNPFYLSYILAHAAPLFAARSLWAVLPWVWMTTVYVRAVRVEERKFMASALAADYQRYCQRTGRFWPRRLRCVSL